MANTVILFVVTCIGEFQIPCIALVAVSIVICFWKWETLLPISERLGRNVADDADSILKSDVWKRLPELRPLCKIYTAVKRNNDNNRPGYPILISSVSASGYSILVRFQAFKFKKLRIRQERSKKRNSFRQFVTYNKLFILFHLDREGPPVNKKSHGSLNNEKLEKVIKKTILILIDRTN